MDLFFYVKGKRGMKSDGTFTENKSRWATFSKEDIAKLSENKLPYGATQRGTFKHINASKKYSADSNLLASSSSLEGIRKLIAEFYYDAPDNIGLTAISDKVWKISKILTGKEITNTEVVLLKGRYRFIMVNKADKMSNRKYSMKMSPEQYTALAKVLDTYINSVGIEKIKEYRAQKLGKDIEKRFRWDLWDQATRFNSIQLNKEGELTNDFSGVGKWFGQFKNLYDSDIETGLKKYVNSHPELNIEGEDKMSSRKYSEEGFAGGKYPGLNVYGLTDEDTELIGNVLENTDYYFEYNNYDDYYFFPESESGYDALEAELSKIFNENNINARFEGVWDAEEGWDTDNKVVSKRKISGKAFMSEITEEDVDRSSTLEESDIGAWAIYCNGAIIDIVEDEDEAENRVNNLNKTASRKYSAKKEKRYRVIQTRYSMSGKDKQYKKEGSLPELIEYYHGTLETGASYSGEKGNKKINMNPKNIDSLMNNLYNAVNNAAKNGDGGRSFDYEEIEESSVESSRKYSEDLDIKPLDMRSSEVTPLWEDYKQAWINRVKRSENPFYKMSPKREKELYESFKHTPLALINQTINEGSPIVDSKHVQRPVGSNRKYSADMMGSILDDLYEDYNELEIIDSGDDWILGRDGDIAVYCYSLEGFTGDEDDYATFNMLSEVSQKFQPIFKQALRDNDLWNEFDENNAYDILVEKNSNMASKRRR